MEGTITKDEYLKLRINNEIYKRLVAGGVDNWQWYSESIYPENKETLDEFEERLQKELSEIGQPK